MRAPPPCPQGLDLDGDFEVASLVPVGSVSVLLKSSSRHVFAREEFRSHRRRQLMRLPRVRSELSSAGLSELRGSELELSR